jgi:hypothetical protein
MIRSKEWIYTVTKAFKTEPEGNMTDKSVMAVSLYLDIIIKKSVVDMIEK